MALVPSSNSSSTRSNDKEEGMGEDATQATSVTTRDELADDDLQDDDGSSCYQEDIANPTRDTLAEGLMGLLGPSLETLDTAVVNTRKAQKELHDKLLGLEDQLREIDSELNCPVDLDLYINKLNTAKKQIVVVNNVLQGAQDRLNRIHQNCLKETARRRSHLESSITTTPTA